MQPERRARPHSDRLETWPRRRERFWALLAAGLAAWLYFVGPVDLEAARVTAAIVEEEDARRAAADGVPPTTLFAADPRELHRLRLVWPVACFAPEAQYIRQWGDGRTPYEAHPVTRQRPFVCVDADLRRRVHVP